MATLITDRDIEQQRQAARTATGADRYDEVWEGTVVVGPAPTDEQQLVNRFAAIFQDVIEWPGLGHVRPGVNVSERVDDWQQNNRVPDVAVVPFSFRLVVGSPRPQIEVTYTKGAGTWNV